MGIRDNIIRWLGSQPPAPPEAAKASYGTSWRTLWMSGNEGDAGTLLPDTPAGWRQAARMVWAANSIAARSNAVAQATLGLYQPADNGQEDAEDAEPIADHPALALLSEPNSTTLGGVSLLATIERHLSIYGDFVAHAVRGSSPEPSELYVLPAEVVEVHRDERGYVAGFFDRVGGQIYSPDDVVRIHYPGDYDPLTRRSPMSSAVESINRYILADVAQQAIDKRGGQGGGIISTNFNMLAVDDERFKAAWDLMRSDPRNAGRDAFLPPGATYMPGVLTAQQQQREERIGRLRKEIFAALSVPPALAGDYTDASVLANADQQWRSFWQLWAVPECDMIAQRLTRTYLWKFWPETKEQGLYLAFDYSNIYALQADEGQIEDVASKKTARANALRAGRVASLNEAREMVGLEPIDDPRADEVLPDESIQTTVHQAPSQDGADKEVTAAPSAKAVMPIVDFVGMTAVALDGETVGRIEKIHRFGSHDGIEATKAAPVVIIDGRAWQASELRVAIEVPNGDA